jgi:hypothetical protein
MRTKSRTKYKVMSFIANHNLPKAPVVRLPPQPLEGFTFDESKTTNRIMTLHSNLKFSDARNLPVMSFGKDYSCRCSWWGPLNNFTRWWVFVPSQIFVKKRGGQFSLPMIHQLGMTDYFCGCCKHWVLQPRCWTLVIRIKMTSCLPSMVSLCHIH